MRYDCLIVLGTQPDLQTWEFPEQIIQCLETAAKLFKDGVSDKIIVSGKWSRRIEDCQLGQPFDECDKLADLLTAQGVDEEAIYRERQSTDTVSNLYYVKQQLLIPLGLKKILFVVADFRIARLEFLVRKVLGPDYQVDYEPVESDEKMSPSYNEAETMARTEKFLANMNDGDHDWLADKFFDHPFYAEVTQRHRAEMPAN